MSKVEKSNEENFDKWKVLSTVDVNDILEVADEFPDIEIDVMPGIDKEKILEIIEEYNGIIAGDIIKYDKEVFEKAKNLKVITRFGVGTDNVDMDDANKYGIMAGNVPGENARSVAEHTLGLIVSASKNLSEADREMRKGNWNRSLGEGYEISGKTLGQIGFGNIGSLVAEKAKLAFDMELLVYDPYVPRYEIENENGKKVKLEELLKESDVITINAPLTEETEDMLGTEEFKKMKDTAIIVNAGRGKIIKENELAEALKKGEIFAAGLDVMREEPTKEENPLFELDHVTVSPHCASNTKETKIRVLRASLEEQMLAFAGKEPQFIKNNP